MNASNRAERALGSLEGHLLQCYNPQSYLWVLMKASEAAGFCTFMEPLMTLWCPCGSLWHSDTNSLFCCSGCAELHRMSDWDLTGSAAHVLCSCSHTSMQMHTMLIIFLTVIGILHLLLLLLLHCKWSKFCGLEHTITAVIGCVIPTILNICCKLNFREILNNLKYYSPFILWWHLQGKTTIELKYAGYYEIHINGSSLYSYPDLCAVKYYALNQFSHLV